MEIDGLAKTFGLPGSLRIPIAAKDLDAITRFVGTVRETTGSIDRLPGAMLVESGERPPKDAAPIWAHPQAAEYEARLFPLQQVWVHVDYARYRAAYVSFGMPPVPPGFVLDHVQNRKAMRLRDLSHPYVRLCPVSRRVNTSCGVDQGAEGMERAHLEGARQGNITAINMIAAAKRQRVVYADPVDITKMLNIVPGMFTLDGVRDVLPLLFPK